MTYLQKNHGRVAVPCPNCRCEMPVSVFVRHSVESERLRRELSAHDPDVDGTLLGMLLDTDITPDSTGVHTGMALILLRTLIATSAHMDMDAASSLALSRMLSAASARRVGMRRVDAAATAVRPPATTPLPAQQPHAHAKRLRRPDTVGSLTLMCRHHRIPGFSVKMKFDQLRALVDAWRATTAS